MKGGHKKRELLRRIEELERIVDLILGVLAVDEDTKWTDEPAAGATLTRAEEGL